MFFFGIDNIGQAILPVIKISETLKTSEVEKKA